MVNSFGILARRSEYLCFPVVCSHRRERMKVYMAASPQLGHTDAAASPPHPPDWLIAAEIHSCVCVCVCPHLGLSCQHVIPEGGGPGTGQLTDIRDDNNRQGDCLQQQQQHVNNNNASIIAKSCSWLCRLLVRTLSHLQLDAEPRLVEV